jgi:citrate lyase synthetase
MFAVLRQLDAVQCRPVFRSEIFDEITPGAPAYDGVPAAHGIRIYPKIRLTHISRAHFPSYFLKKESDTTETQARLDAVLFRDRIAPALGITHRTVGEETLDAVTALYNDCLAHEFKDSITLTVIPRVQTENGEAISASRVRGMLLSGRLKDIEPLVPATTLRYFKSFAGKRLVRSWTK